MSETHQYAVGWSLQANMTYFLWTSNPVHDISLEDEKYLN